VTHVPSDDEPAISLPPDVQQTASLRAWAGAIAGAGNELRAARLEWAYRGSPHGSVYCWAIRPTILIHTEDRVRDNELVLSRADLATVLAYHPAARLDDSEIVLVREFRAAGVTTDGFVHELPGGSDPTGTGDLRAVAAREFTEETGVALDPDRLCAHRARQLAATFSTHRMHLFSVELSRTEIEAIRADRDQHCDHENTEITYVEVRSYADLLASSDVDWTTFGAISEVLLGRYLEQANGCAQPTVMSD
jgi:8-oxo-dGTP pyrophosphatase MutT (NUDIX family)